MKSPVLNVRVNEGLPQYWLTINSSNICLDDPLLLFNCPVISKWEQNEMPATVLFERDIFGFLKLNRKLCFISRFQWLMPELLHRPYFEILVHSFLPVLVCVSERIPNQQGSLHTRKFRHKNTKGKEDMHKLESKRLLPIWICHKTHYQRSTGKLPLLQFFLHFFRQLGLGPPNETSIAWKTYLGTAQNLLQLDFSRSTLYTPIFSNFFHSREIFFSHILYHLGYSCLIAPNIFRIIRLEWYFSSTSSR